MRDNNQRRSDQTREQARRMSRNSQVRYENDDEYVTNNHDYHEDRPRQRASRSYAQQRYEPRHGFNFAWIIVPLLLVAVAALGFGAYSLMSKTPLAQIVSVTPNYTTIKKPYNSCHKEATTSYVANQKNGTDGALIGGATGAVAGGIIGNQVKQGGGGTIIGAVLGGATGALAGREIQRSNQPDYVAKHGSTTKCATLYKSVRVKSGSYTVQYNYKDTLAKMVTNSAPAIGATLPMAQLQALAVN
ncbi:MAG: glycine zipper 2TM domain-containing protein [Burkholderiales bacterium]|nr:glycine zipper 2TM domain-containing protein [Burkholderiales bacterium]